MISQIVEQHDAAKLSKSQKKKKSAQKKKAAKKNERLEREQAQAEARERPLDELDARVVDRHFDEAIHSKNYELLTMRGTLIVHPPRPFLHAMTDLRQQLCREIYPNRVQHARMLLPLGLADGHSSTWPVAMGLASINSENSFHAPVSVDRTSVADREHKTLRWAHTTQAFNVGILVWYPVLTACLEAGDKLACIALRDTCVRFRAYYEVFRRDLTRLEQYVFDARDPVKIKQLEWVARRIEIPPSPPSTPPLCSSETPPSSSSSDQAVETPEARDPFRCPDVMTKRWADYDDDDDSLGSPMSLPATPRDTDLIPALTLDRPRRPPTQLVATPTLTATPLWQIDGKAVFPTPRMALYTFEDYPRTHATPAPRPMRLQSSVTKYVPSAASANVRVQARRETWEKDPLVVIGGGAGGGKSARIPVAARKMLAAQSMFNRVHAISNMNTHQPAYIGELDLLGAAGVYVEDVRDMAVGRFRETKEASADEGDLRVWSRYWGSETERVKVVLTRFGDGWVCNNVESFNH